MELGERIYRLRLRKGMTQQYLADFAGITAETINSIERSKHSPRISTVSRIAEAFGMRLDQLCAGVVIESEERKGA